MTDSDILNRFLFKNSDVRGEIITLQDSYQEALSKSEIPPEITNLIGEFMAAAGLLTATLKFEGIITLQARGEGPVELLMADITHQHNLRAVTQVADNADLSSSDIRDLIGHNGHLNITIDANKGDRYQGIVPLDQPTLAACLETYFRQSEQIPTRIWLNANGKTAGGLMIQALPEQKAADADSGKAEFEHIIALADTITAEEQLTLNHNDQLYRLFHQEELQLFEPKQLQFSCSCSRARTEKMLRTIGREEIQQILEDQGIIEINCHFCLEPYRFTANDIDTIFDGEPPVVH